MSGAVVGNKKKTKKSKQHKRHVFRTIDVGVELLLDLVEAVAILVGDQINR